jgi:hypothetical protein
MTSRARPMGRVSGRLRLAAAGAPSAGSDTSRDTVIEFELDRGRVRSLDVPGDGTLRSSRGSATAATWWASTSTRDGVVHGYRWENGRFTTLDGPTGTGASITDINDRGAMVGLYALDASNPLAGLRGFMLRNGKYTTSPRPASRSPPPSTSTTGARSLGTRSAIPLTQRRRSWVPAGRRRRRARHHRQGASPTIGSPASCSTRAGTRPSGSGRRRVP